MTKSSLGACMRTVLRPWVVVSTLACGAPTQTTATAAAPNAASTPRGPVRHVIVVTLDGLMPEVYRRPDAHGLQIPVLRRLVAEGASSDGALSVFPTLTYPAHASIASGVSPARPEMKASLISFGAGQAQGVLADARLIDIAPTVASWLGLELGPVDGKPLELVAAHAQPQ